jgi:hypothetical protein
MTPDTNTGQVGTTGADLIPVLSPSLPGRCSLAGTGPGVHTGIQGGEHAY